MDAFRRGEIQVLVCTSVVEVGVDVPNATLMTIESGQRFGLAQLHQLRGRIGRGRFPGFCCVFAEPQTAEAEERLKAFVATTDGFELAEKDFHFAGRATCSARSSTACRRCGLPTCWATCRCWKRRAATRRRWSQPIRTCRKPEHARLRRMMLYGKVTGWAIRSWRTSAERGRKEQATDGTQIEWTNNCFQLCFMLCFIRGSLLFFAM